MLAAVGRGREPGVDALLRSRSLGVFRLRMVLVFGLFLGLGTVPLWPLVSPQSLRMVLGSGHSLGTVVGKLALQSGLLWLGAVAANRLLSSGSRLYLLRSIRQRELRIWTECESFYFRRGKPFY